MGKTFAKIFSTIFHPLLLPSIGIIILYNSGSVLEYLPFQAKKIILLVVGVSTFVLPLTFVPFFIRYFLMLFLLLQRHCQILFAKYLPEHQK